MEEIYLGKAFWNQRYLLANSMPRVRDLIKAVGRPTDLELYQWVGLMSCVLEFKPDLILELGRGWGNSTCAFTETAFLMKPAPCRVVSLCLSDDWQNRTLPKISPLLPEDWLDHVETLQEDILLFDFKKLFKNYHRIVIFWDAHGYDIAEKMFGEVLRFIEKQPHLVIMHDLSDARYLRPGSHLYKGNNLWRGKTTFEGPRVRLGHINSAVEQAVAAVDFTSRNGIYLNSAGHGLNTFFESEPEKLEEMKRLLGEDACILQGDFFWFTLNDLTQPPTYPSYVRKASVVPKSNRISVGRRLSYRLHETLNRMDLPEKNRVLVRKSREMARTLDCVLFKSFFYDNVYKKSPPKNSS